MTEVASTVDPTLSASEHELAKVLLAESREELTRADGKASLLLAALGIGLSAILGAMLAGDWSPFDLERPWELIWWAGAAAAGAAAFGLGAAIWPKVRHGNPSQGVAYFGDAASYKKADDLRAALKSDLTDPATRTVSQLHVISKRADTKYAFIRASLVALGVAVTLALVGVFGDHWA